MGVFRLLDPFDDMVAGLPPGDREWMRSFLNTSSHWRSTAEESAAWDDSSALGRAVASLGDTPVLAITAGEIPADVEVEYPQLKPLLYELHRELAALSTKGRHRIIAGAQHVTLVTEEVFAQQVIDGIRELVEEVRRAADDANREHAL